MKKKRLNAQAKKETKNALNKQKGQQYLKPKASEALQLNAVKEIKNDEISKQDKKSTAKKMGLKSTLVTCDKVVVTSFVNKKGTNGSNIEKVTSHKGEKIAEGLYTERMFKTDVTEDEICISKQEHNSTFINPAKKDIGRDYLGVKEILENKYFSGPKSDNVHVQIGYNIMDIRKIITAYVNNIVSLFYNLNRSAKEDQRDIIGTLGEFYNLDSQENKALEDLKTKEKLDQIKEIFNKGAIKYYFKDIFKIVPSLSKDDKENPEKLAKYEEEKRKVEDYNFNVLRVLTMMRNLCYHSKNRAGTGGDIGLLNLERVVGATNNSNTQDNKELLELIQNVCVSSISKINENFVSNSGNNVYVLSQLYPGEDVLKQYYSYVVEKENRNIGVNLTKIREVIFDVYLTELKDKEYDTYRNKIYTILGFILYKELTSSSILDKMIEELRFGEKNEVLRDSVYETYAKKIYIDLKLKEKYENAIKELKKEKENKFESKKEIALKDIKEYAINANGISCFVQSMLFLTKFLDGKETNELICALINKFDNIADILEVAKQIGLEVEFASDYISLNDSRKISKDLRLIKNIAHLKDKKTKTKNDEKANDQEDKIPFVMLLDAYNMLNVKADSQIVYGSKEANELYNLIYKTQKKGTDKNSTQKYNYQFKNFIENNVIKSKWFLYIAKYVDPANCATFMANEAILNFVVKELPPKQILRYYQTITGSEVEVSEDQMRKSIIYNLKRFSVKDSLTAISDMSEEEYKPKTKDITSSIEKQKAIVSLYLTVAFLIVKSMVKVNTRFSIAFNCLERDLVLKGHNFKNYDKLTTTYLKADKEIIDDTAAEIEKIYLDFKNATDATAKEQARKLLNKTLKARDKKMHFSYKKYKEISSNLENAIKNKINFTAFRNAIEHLNVIKAMPNYFKEVKNVQSYYALFCYILQRLLIEEGAIDNQVLADKIVAEGGYSKRVQNLMWQLNLPFAYNLPRYKNLSMESLFYSKDNMSNLDKKDNV